MQRETESGNVPCSEENTNCRTLNVLRYYDYTCPLLIKFKIQTLKAVTMSIAPTFENPPLETNVCVHLDSCSFQW